MKGSDFVESLTTAISVQVDSHDKEVANSILKKLGLNMSTFVNMAIKQLINNDGIPFEVKNPKPSKELLEALQEGEVLLRELREGKTKGYHNVDEMFKDILSEED